MPKIIYQTVWASDKRIGRAYNQAMQDAPKDAWVCFMDGDAMFTTKFWGKQIEDVIDRFKGNRIGMFTCMTNRVHNKKQLVGGKMSNDYNFLNHVKIGDKLYETYGSKCLQLSKMYPCSGVLMLVNPVAWKSVKFRELTGLAGVDNFFHKDLIKSGWHVMLMQGVYVFHKYDNDRSHLR